MASSSLNVSLPKKLRDYVSSRASAGGYSTPSEYVRELIREDRKRQAQEKLEQMLLEGLASDRLIEVNKSYWAERRRELTRIRSAQNR